MPYTNSYMHFTSLEKPESPLFRHPYEVLDSTQIQDEIQSQTRYIAEAIAIGNFGYISGAKLKRNNIELIHTRS